MSKVIAYFSAVQLLSSNIVHQLSKTSTKPDRQLDHHSHTPVATYRSLFYPCRTRVAMDDGERRRGDAEGGYEGVKVMGRQQVKGR